MALGRTWYIPVQTDLELARENVPAQPQLQGVWWININSWKIVRTL